MARTDPSDDRRLNGHLVTRSFTVDVAASLDPGGSTPSVDSDVATITAITVVLKGVPMARTDPSEDNETE